MRRALLAGGLGLVVLVAAACALRLAGIGVPEDAPDAQTRLLAPDWRLTLPEGRGPHPGLALFSGCDGVHDNMDRWAALARAQGWATLIVDSHTPRGIDAAQLWRLVCAGQLLGGGERAADVAVALDHLRDHPEVDGARLAVLGASHGGWAILDLLAFADADAPPYGLEAWPGGGPEAALDGLRGALLLYPYCGAASLAGRSGWQAEVPVLMILVEDDTITGDAPCRELARRQAGRGLPVETVTFDGVTHGFDQKERAALSPLRFDAAATERAMAMGRDWLQGLAAR